MTDASGITMTRLDILTHTGTHIDLPGHLSVGAGRPSEEAILRASIGRARVVRLPASRRQGITLDELRSSLAGRCPRRLLLRAGAARGLSPEAASWLAERCLLVGTDQLSIDPPRSSLDAHRILLSAGVLILENLRLERIAAGSYHLLSLPLRLGASDGAPVRALLRRSKGRIGGG